MTSSASDVHDFQRVYLVGDAHDAYLCCHGGACSGRYHDCGEHGSHFAYEREGEKGTEHALGTEHGHGIEGLQAEDEPREEADEQDDEHGVRADDIDLPQDLACQAAGSEGLTEAVGKEAGHVAQAMQKGDGGSAYFFHFDTP